MYKILLALLLTSVCLGAYADDTAAYRQQARHVAMELVKQLGGELKQQLARGDPAAAISVCKDKAPAIASELSRKTGWQVTRVSLKVRDPLLGTPDAWEQKGLMELERRMAKGEKPDTLEIAQVVDEPSGKVFRYLKALPVKPMCLMCHGTPDEMPAAIKAKLAQEYPHDKAVGYRPGMLRGAISIKRPL
jgi:hypothetical protein